MSLHPVVATESSVFYVEQLHRPVSGLLPDSVHPVDGVGQDINNDLKHLPIRRVTEELRRLTVKPEGV